LHGAVLQRTHKRRLEHAQGIVERVDDEPERNVLLEFGRPTVED
jgi:hypothetical protein